MKQLLENKVRVKFWREGYAQPYFVLHFDLVIDAERRAMGMKCAEWQSEAVGNRVESEVLTIRRSGDR